MIYISKYFFTVVCSGTVYVSSNKMKFLGVICEFVYPTKHR